MGSGDGFFPILGYSVSVSMCWLSSPRCEMSAGIHRAMVTRGSLVPLTTKTGSWLHKQSDLVVLPDNPGCCLPVPLPVLQVSQYQHSPLILLSEHIQARACDGHHTLVNRTEEPYQDGVFPWVVFFFLFVLFVHCLSGIRLV